MRDLFNNIMKNDKYAPLINGITIQTQIVATDKYSLNDPWIL